MRGPITLIRSNKITECKNLGAIYEWSEGNAYLIIDRVIFRKKMGAILCYYNPPVHQVGNPALDAYLEALKKVLEKKHELGFLILCGANDPVHAGGDLKESLTKLDRTLERKKELEKKGASEQEMDRLFHWADDRLKKGKALHASIRKVAQFMRVTAVCGGGTRFGGSAEIPLMADYVVGDSRSAICFSEATIGLIPGWAGIARTLIKAGPTNAEYMAKTSKEIKADQLQKIGIYNVVVDISLSFPKKEKTGDPESDKAAFQSALEVHNEETGMILLPKVLEIATCTEEQMPVLSEAERATLAPKEEIRLEVTRRKDPQNYSDLWGKPLREVKGAIAEMGRPLAPQSIEALTRLFEGYDPATFNEHAFVEEEMEADARLYRDPRFRVGLTSTLEQRVPDYREAN